jgi:hypothetical protein
MVGYALPLARLGGGSGGGGGMLCLLNVEFVRHRLRIPYSSIDIDFLDCSNVDFLV